MKTKLCTRVFDKYIIILLISEFFTPALADSFPLESE